MAPPGLIEVDPSRLMWEINGQGIKIQIYAHMGKLSPTEHRASEVKTLEVWRSRRRDRGRKSSFAASKKENKRRRRHAWLNIRLET